MKTLNFSIKTIAIALCVSLIYSCSSERKIPKQLFLFAACSRGDIKNIKKLIEKDKIDINSTDKSGQSAIFYAVSHGNFHIAEYLLDNGAKINIVDKDKDSPLSIAIVQNNYEIAELLLEYGADANIQIGDNYTPLTYARFCKHNMIASLLIKYGAKGSKHKNNIKKEMKTNNYKKDPL